LKSVGRLKRRAERQGFAASEAKPKELIMTFDELGLAEPIARAVSDKGYTQPSPIQEQAIPVVLKGGDLMASAQTGTGKTAAFTLPILHRLLDMPRASNNQARVLILTPTRELAAQILENVEAYSKYTKLRSTVVFGGVKINPQMQKLRGGVEVLVATPGRLLDLFNQRAVRFDELEMLVLDEADRMLDMGFIHDIKRILKVLPAKRQNLLFSATFSDDIRGLARGLLNQPAEVSVARENTTGENIEHKLHPVDKTRKTALLSHLTLTHGWDRALVFSRTKHGANKLVKLLDRDGIKAAAIHGNKSQNQRTKALADFKNGDITLLIATDIAARGIDIDQLPQVVNFDLPNVPEDYVHRIGRTGRAGSSGQAISLVSEDEMKQLQDIERVIQRHIEREEVEGFKPERGLPASREIRAIKPSRPRKPQASGRGDAPSSAKAPRRKRTDRTNSSNATSAGPAGNRPNNRGGMGSKPRSSGSNNSGNNSGNRSGDASGNR